MTADDGDNATPSGGLRGEAWHGLAELTPHHREQLADGIAPAVASHLERCLQHTLVEWEEHAASGVPDGDWGGWAGELRRFRVGIAEDFGEAVLHDLRSPDYPPAYEFSGIAFAHDDSGLAILDDYQTARRSLRHGLEAVVRADHTYSHLVFTRAAQAESRFQHANWAPWSPLNWFERLFEAAERHLGRTDAALELMRAYLRCLSEFGHEPLGTAVETLDACGLVDATTLAPEPDSDREPLSSWLHYRQPVQERLQHGDVQPLAGTGHSTGGSLHAPLRLRLVETGADRELLPRTDADPGAWIRWARAVLHAAGRDGSATTSEAWHEAGKGNAGNHPDGVVGADDTTPSGSPADAEQAPVGQQLQPWILAVLEGVCDRIFRQAGVNAAAEVAIRALLPALATEVVHDLDFFHERRHPLRRWLGELINAGVHVSPEQVDLGAPGVARLLERIDEFTSRLRGGGTAMNRRKAEALFFDWSWAMEADHAAWQTRLAAPIQAARQREHVAQACRGVTVSVLETGADLPESAARQIAEAWGALLDIIPGDPGLLNQDIRAVVRAICRKASAAEVNGLVVRMLSDARESGMEQQRVKTLVNGLGQAHLLHMRSPRNLPRFDPRRSVQERRAVRLADDDPDLVDDYDDRHVFEANRIRVGDWLEFLDRSSGSLQRMALVWRGEASRAFLFVSLDESMQREHSLQGVADELRAGRARLLPRDNPLDAVLH